MPQFVLGLFLLGCLGGAVPDLLRIIKNRYKASLPKYLRSANFWIGLVILIGIGGLTAWILEATTAKDALLYGYAAPQILSSLAGLPVLPLFGRLNDRWGSRKLAIILGFFIPVMPLCWPLVSGPWGPTLPGEILRA